MNIINFTDIIKGKFLEEFSAISLTGAVSAILLAFVLSFIPPGQIQTGSNAVWYSVLFIGCIVLVGVPFIIYANRKESWLSKDSGFEPFHWEMQK